MLIRSPVLISTRSLRESTETRNKGGFGGELKQFSDNGERCKCGFPVNEFEERERSGNGETGFVEIMEMVWGFRERERERECEV